MRFAHIKNNTVANIILADQEFADAQTDMVLVALADDSPVAIGWLHDGTDFTEPAPVPMPEPQRIAALWQGAHDLEYAAISGSAIGLITMGVMQSLPKCIAVQGWIKSIWAIYYTRKAGTSTDTDYSSAGACPHTVPELMEELGV